MSKLTDFDILNYLCTTGDANDIMMTPELVSSVDTKIGSKITMGIGVSLTGRILAGELMPVLYLFNKEKFFEIKKAGKLPEAKNQQQ